MKRLFADWIPSTLLVVCLAGGLHASLRGAEDWRPVDPAHLAMSEGKVDPNADAEAIFWEVHVEDQVGGGDVRNVLEHYIRIKIFNDRGRDAQSSIDIPYIKGTRIDRIAARTILPDGDIVPLDEKSIYERTLVKAGGVKIQAKSFAMPGVVPRCIIEYRWRETRGDSFSQYSRLEFQRDIPVQLVKYYIKSDSAFARAGYGMLGLMFNGSRSPFEKESKGFVSTSMTNVTAFHEEKDMPPDVNVRSWMLLYYTDQKENITPQEFWRGYSKELHRDFKGLMKPNGDVKKLAAELSAGASTEEEKLKRFHDYCRTKIRSMFDDAVELTEKERKQAKKNNSPSDTLKRGVGSDLDVDMLFAALAAAAGFEVRYARVGDRSDYFFNPNLPTGYFLPSWVIAVQVGGDWKFYSPASRHVTFGMLPWYQESQTAVLADPDQALFATTPTADAGQSQQKRTAHLQLDADGTLRGSCRVEFTGHQASSRRESLDDETDEERVKAVEEVVHDWFNNAEVSEVRVEELGNPEKPLVYAWEMRLPGYAQATGKRLFLQPALFQKGSSPRYSAGSRHYDIYFNYKWSEEDEVIIDLPEGITLEAPQPPPSFKNQQVIEYDTELASDNEGKTVTYRRRFAFNALFVSADSYGALKGLFDQIHERDGHTLILRQAEPSAEGR